MAQKKESNKALNQEMVLVQTKRKIVTEEGRFPVTMIRDNKGRMCDGAPVEMPIAIAKRFARSVKIVGGPKLPKKAEEAPTPAPTPAPVQEEAGAPKPKRAKKEGTE